MIIDNLYFTSQATPRFTEHFYAVWRSLPLGSRRRMLHYFRASAPAPVMVVIWPPIFDADTKTLGMWKRGSRCFYFWDAIVDTLPDNLLRTLIAHELAHCCIDAYDHSDTNDEEAAR